MHSDRLIELLTMKRQQLITPAAQAELNLFLEEEEGKELLVAVLEQMIMDQIPDGEYDEIRFEPVINNILQLDSRIHPTQVVKAGHRIHFLRRWSWVAAVLVILAGVAVFYVVNDQTVEKTATTAVSKVSNDIAPGGNRAVLTLADGTQIILDSAASGQLAEQGNASITKTANGGIVYKATGTGDEAEVMMNRMSTPVGGQYQLTLPDGTKAWLNAASSISYPAVFSKQLRTVSVTGEVYFEVAKDKKRPFIAQIKNKVSVEVLGTHFNINSYEDDGQISTTLLEGSVKVSAKQQGVELQPGHQANINSTTEKIMIDKKADIVKIMAWKNGLFNFDGADLKTVMLQLSRWYDIQVVYEGKIPVRTFKGKMDRELTLKQVLKILQETDVKFKLEGHQLTIQQ